MEKLYWSGIEYRRFDRLYFVSADGNVLRKGLPVEVRTRPDGYINVGRQRLLHRMVAVCWCKRPEGANTVHHINHDKSDNRAINLEWLTPKQHMSEKHEGISRGHAMSEAGKKKLRALRLGTKTSEETKRKQREASLRLGCKPPPRPVGTKLSAESVEKIRANSAKNTACEVDGVLYRSFSDAGRALGIRPHTLRKRCLSEAFPSYKVRK